MLVKNIVHKQLKAMGAKNYEIGVDSSHEAEQFIIKTVSQNEILDLKFLKWLQACNCNGRNIYIRPIAPSNLSFVDDVSIETLKCLEEENLIPCCIVESSPNNFHLWFKHSDILDNDISTQVAKLLSRKLEGDPSSADFRHFGRLAGFTNRKRIHVADGRFPFVKLRASSGSVLPISKELIDEAAGMLKTTSDREICKQAINKKVSSTLLSWEDFYNNSKYEGDFHRVDIAYAIYAFSKGIKYETIETSIRSRDLSHKGSLKRQDDYIERTLDKAERISI